MSDRSGSLPMLWSRPEPDVVRLVIAVMAPTAAITGVATVLIGTGWGLWAATVHGIAALCLALAVPAHYLFGLSDRRRGGFDWWRTVLLLTAFVVALVSGVLRARGLRSAPAGTTWLTIHFVAGAAFMVLGAIHVVARRRAVGPIRVDRRAFLRAGAIAGVGTAGFVALEGVNTVFSLPGADRRFSGSYEIGSFVPDDMPSVTWLNDDKPLVDPDEWELTLSGGDAAQSIPYDALRSFDDQLTAVLDCTGGWYSEQHWTGARLDRLLPSDARGRSVVVRSATGYSRRFPLGDASKMLIAHQLGDETLSPGHGFPARLVAPGRRGFWWVKWVTEVEVSNTPWWWQLPVPPT